MSAIPYLPSAVGGWLCARASDRVSCSTRSIQEVIVSDAETGDVEQRIARLEQYDQRLTRAIELLAERGAGPAGQRRRDWDALAAVIASFIGLLALAVAGYTAYVQRQQLRAQVWPRLEVSYSNNDQELAWHVHNQGTGPARVFAVRVVVGGTLVTTWGGVRKAADYVDGERATMSSITQSVLPAGKDVAMFRAGEDPQSRTRFQELLSGGKHALSVTICYCSVLDDCFVTTDQARPPIDPSPPDSCPIKRNEQFVD
jgi:hypothetical protein